MDLIKIGSFIKECRKDKNLTQEDLAEKLNISPKTVSKWECAKGLPDVSIMVDLCKELSISINELLNGEHIESKDYMDKAEQKLLEMQEEKAKKDKSLLNAEIFIGALSTVMFLACVFGFAYLMEIGEVLWGILALVVGIIIFIPSVAFCLYIEQKAGFYKCAKCGHKFIPTYKQVTFAPHAGRSRYMTCPNCKQKSYCKKVIK